MVARPPPTRTWTVYASIPDFFSCVLMSPSLSAPAARRARFSFMPDRLRRSGQDLVRPIVTNLTRFPLVANRS